MESRQVNNLQKLNLIEPEKNDEMMNHIKDCFTCWICLELIEHPFFCPNKNCMKGVHKNCIDRSKEEIKCICGNKFKKEEWKSNLFIESLSYFTLNANEILKNFESLKCSVHKNELLKHYCYDCKNAYCGTCIITTKENNHINHRLMNFDQFKEIEKEINANIEFLQKEILEIDESYNNYCAFKTSLLNKLKEWVANIENQSDKIQKEMEENKKIIEEIINKIKKNYDEFFNNLEKDKYNEISNLEETKTKILNNLIIENNDLFNEAKSIKNSLLCIKEEYNRKIPKIINLINTKYITKIYEDGKYEGDFLNGKKEGEGIIYYNNGDKYDGEWVNDNAEGKGIYYQKNGDIYVGEWKNDKREGRGILYTNNGCKYDGEWTSDQKNGKGKIYWDDGEKFEGEWKNNKKEGLGIYYYNNGDREIKEYKNNENIKILMRIKTNGDIEYEH